MHDTRRCSIVLAAFLVVGRAAADPLATVVLAVEKDEQPKAVSARIEQLVTNDQLRAGNDELRSRIERLESLVNSSLTQ